MIKLDRRRLLQSIGLGSAAALSTIPAASASTLGPEREGFPSTVADSSRKLHVLLPRSDAVFERHLVEVAQALFPAWWDQETSFEPALPGGALWALDAFPSGIALASSRDVIRAVADGLPIVSVAELGKGFGLDAVARPGLNTAEELPSGLRLRAGGAGDAALWAEIALRLGLRKAVMVPPGPGFSIAQDLVTEAADLALVSPLERAVMAASGLDFERLELPGLDCHPWLCLATRRDALEDRTFRRRLSGLVATLRGAANFAARNPDAVVALLARSSQLPVADPQETLRRLLSLGGKQRHIAPADRRFGLHDPAGWAALIAAMAPHAPCLRRISVGDVLYSEPMPVAHVRISRRLRSGEDRKAASAPLA